MPDLEQAIAEWRQRMLAAGIGSPVPLEELEEHLRDEVERQMQSGIGAAEAFRLAVEKVGQPRLLETEFRRSDGFMTWLGADPRIRIVRVLGLLLLVSFALDLIVTGEVLYEFIQKKMLGAALILTMFPMLFMYIRGLVASVRLFNGNTSDKRLLWLLAIFFSVGGIRLLIPNSPGQHLQFGWSFCANMLLNVASIWFLRPIRKQTLANK